MKVTIEFEVDDWFDKTHIEKHAKEYGISRKQDNLIHFAEHVINNEGLCGVHGRNYKVVDVSTELTEEDQQASEPDFYGKWIDVDCRLPSEGVWVIGLTYLFTPITGEKKPISKELFFDGENEHGIHWLCDGDWPNKVTHWMPLPPAKTC